MNRRILAAASLLPLSLAACAGEPEPEPALAGAWTLDSADSRLAFVSVKAGELAEAHRFDELSGSVSAEGMADLTINLASVNTAIDIRNERMREMLFETTRFAEASATAQLDPAAFTSLAIGETQVQPVTTTLDLHGRQEEVTTDLAVTRIGADKVGVETTAPIIVDARNFGLGEGIDALREIAGLPGITPQVPVTFSLTFTRAAAAE